MLYFLFVLGTWKERTKDKLRAMKAKRTEKLNSKMPSCLKTLFQWLMCLKKILAFYLDLVTDTILLGTVLTVIELSYYNYEDFESQVALILLSSIVIPIVLSAMMIAFTRPLVISNPNQWKKFKTDQNLIPIFVIRIIILLFFPLMPAIIIISNENAKEQRKSLKINEVDTVTNATLEECDDITTFIDETRQGQL